MVKNNKKEKKELIEYDVIIIGSGSAASLIDASLQKGYKTALIDRGPAGGTCLNVGCIPSKMLISVADRITEIRESDKFHVKSKIEKINFQEIMKDMKKETVPTHKNILKSLREASKKESNFDFYNTTGKFVDKYILEVEDKLIKGKRIFIASGSRPLIPKIKNIEKTDYLTNETLLDLKELPKSIVIIGGGYISCEYAHFFSALGSEVTILQSNKTLVPAEDEEISKLLEQKLSKRIKIHTNTRAEEVKELGNNKIQVIAKNKGKGKKIKLSGEKILLATGRTSNADILNTEKTNLELDKRGYLKTNEFMETNMKGIYCFGDANGKAMFTHAANEEAPIAWHNSQLLNKKTSQKVSFDYSKVPHAIFTHPSIAGIGLNEEQTKDKIKNKELTKEDILVGKANYTDIAKGKSLRQEGTFAKAIINKNNGEILGFHIMGPEAPVLIQEVTNAISNNQTLNSLARGIHIHPALSELILRTFSNLRRIQ